MKIASTGENMCSYSDWGMEREKGSRSFSLCRDLAVAQLSIQLLSNMKKKQVEEFGVCSVFIVHGAPRPPIYSISMYLFKRLVWPHVLKNFG